MLTRVLCFQLCRCFLDSLGDVRYAIHHDWHAVRWIGDIVWHHSRPRGRVVLYVRLRGTLPGVNVHSMRGNDVGVDGWEQILDVSWPSCPLR